MNLTPPNPNPYLPSITLRPVGHDNWRAVANIKVTPEQYAQEFVVEPAFYLALCAYGGAWHPLAIYRDEEVIGFLMWAIDSDDPSWCWLGGIMLDQSEQGLGYGKQAVRAALDWLTKEQGHRKFALSYYPHNEVAKHIYSTLGFVEQDEWEDNEVVARLQLPE